MIKDRSALVFGVGQPKEALVELTDRQHSSSDALKRVELFIARKAQRQEIFSNATVETANNCSVHTSICQLLLVAYLTTSSVSRGLYNVDGRNMRNGKTLEGSDHDLL